MFDNIKEYFKELKIKNNLIKEFMDEHGTYLPKYSPQGQPLEWDISVHKNGEYDLFTGKQSGEYSVGIVQKCPCGGIMSDTNVYGYDTTTKKIKKTMAHWQ